MSEALHGFVEIVKTADKTSKIFQALDFLTKKDVLIGVPQEKSSREGQKITNAELAYIHSNGSPIRNIPARPFLEPSIQQPDTKEKIQKEFKQAINEVLQGNKDNIEKHLQRAGIIASGAAKNWFTNPENNWSPLAQSTLKAKIRKFKKNHKTKYKKLISEGLEPEFTPLIDTGELRKSITYVIRDK